MDHDSHFSLLASLSIFRQVCKNEELIKVDKTYFSCQKYRFKDAFSVYIDPFSMLLT